MKIGIAMSGGLDSSAAAIMLMEQGHEVAGFTMQQFDNKAYGFGEHEGSVKAVEDAARVCETLGIEHHVVHLEKEFDQIVVGNFIEEYKCARTPNTCALCNPTIKFGLFMDAVVNAGYDKMATGHYAKLIEENGKIYIERSDHKRKDQSYMLWRLSPEQLKRLIFPLESVDKEFVRDLAEENSLHISKNKESQDNCFIKGHYKDFLRDRVEFIAGDIKLDTGEVLGRHNGIILYTIGQRKGLDIAWRAPLYVYKLDAETNTVWVTENRDLLMDDTFSAHTINWFADDYNADNLVVQIRYNSRAVDVESLSYDAETDRLDVKLVNPVSAITPGQSAVFYRGDRLIGGGVIG